MADDRKSNKGGKKARGSQHGGGQEGGSKGATSRRVVSKATKGTSKSAVVFVMLSTTIRNNSTKLPYAEPKLRDV